MNEPNPYATPESDVAVEVNANASLSDLDFKKLKKLYYRSCNVNAITFLIGLALIFILVGLFQSRDQIDSLFLLMISGLVVFYVLAIVGLYTRKSWGRILGIIVSVLSLINVPVGTLIGIFGLFAFIGSPQLFGENRFTHEALKTEFKWQKTKQKRAKRA